MMMPNCFSLTKVGTRQPESLQKVDDDMRRHFGAPADPDRWYKGWYDTIGFAIAMGKQVDWIRENMSGLNEVTDWLAGHYEWNAWASR